MERFSSRNIPLDGEADCIYPSKEEEEEKDEIDDDDSSSPGAGGEAGEAVSSQGKSRQVQLRHPKSKAGKGVHSKAIKVEFISSNLPSNLVDNLNSTGVNLISLLESFKIDSFGDSFNSGDSSCSLYASNPPLTYLNMRKIVNRFLSSSSRGASESASKLNRKEQQSVGSFERQNNLLNSQSPNQFEQQQQKELEVKKDEDEQVKSLVNTKSEEVPFGSERRAKKNFNDRKCGWKIQLPLNLPNSTLLTHYTNGAQSNVSSNIGYSFTDEASPSAESIGNKIFNPISLSPEGNLHPISTFPWNFNFISNSGEKENNVHPHHPHLHASSHFINNTSAPTSSPSAGSLVTFSTGSFVIPSELPTGNFFGKRTQGTRPGGITTAGVESIESNSLIQLTNNPQYPSSQLTFNSRAKQNEENVVNVTTKTLGKLNQINTSKNVNGKLNLVIFIENFYFTKHPLFSEEHTYASKLLVAYENYQNFIQQQRVKLICQKIDSVKISLANLKAKLTSNANYSSSSSSSSPPSPTSPKQLDASDTGKKSNKKSVRFSSDIEDDFYSSPNSPGEVKNLSKGTKSGQQPQRQPPSTGRKQANVNQLNINKDDEIDFTTLQGRITEYTIQLRHLYCERRSLLQQERNLLNQLIECWNEVENVRKRSQFVSTNVQLELETMKPDQSVVEEEGKLLNRKIDEEFQVELFYADHLQNEYLKEMKEWQKYKKMMKVKNSSSKGHKSSSQLVKESMREETSGGEEDENEDEDVDENDDEDVTDAGDGDEDEQGEGEDGEQVAASHGEFECETVPRKASASHTMSKHMNELLESVGVNDEKGQSNDKSIGQKVTWFMSQRHINCKPIEPSPEFTNRELLFQNIHSTTLLSDTRLPGEMIVSRINLSYANSILSLDTQCPSFEKKRRKDVLKRKYQIILTTRSSLRPSGQNGTKSAFNGQQVKRSSKGTILPFDGSFKVSFTRKEDETPHKQQQTKWTLEINDVTLDTPIHVTLDEFNSVPFVSTKGKQRNIFNGSIDILPEEWQRSLDTSLVSQVKFKWPANDEADSQVESIEGVITFKLFWDNLNEGNIEKLVTSKFNSTDSLTLNSVNQLNIYSMPSSITDASVEDLLIWKEKYASQLDPYDPDTIKILKFIQQKTQEELSKKKSSPKSSFPSQVSNIKHQHQHHHSTPTNLPVEALVELKNGKFANLTDELNKPRIKLLLARSSGIPSLKNVPIPLNEREIGSSLLNVLDDDLTNSSITSGSSKVLQSVKCNSIEGKRLKGILKLKQIREKLLMQSADRFGKPRVLSDLVHEQASDNL